MTLLAGLTIGILLGMPLVLAYCIAELGAWPR